MSQIDIRRVQAADHAAWLPLWQAYLRFYDTQLPDAVSTSTWQRLLDRNEPTHSALAWQDGKAVGMVNFIYHRSNWSIESSCYLQDLFVDAAQRGAGVAGGRLNPHIVETPGGEDLRVGHAVERHTSGHAQVVGVFCRRRLTAPADRVQARYVADQHDCRPRQ